MGKRSRPVLWFGLSALLCLGAQSLPADPLYREGLRLMQQGYYHEARLYLEQAQAKDPDNPELHFSLGIVYYKQKNYQLAYGRYQKALTLLPRPELKGRIQGALADIFFQLEDFKQASQAYQQALFFLPQSKGLRLRLAMSFMRLQNSRAALAETEKLLKAYPLLEEAYQLRSLIQLSQANYSQALQDFEKSLEQKQPDWESWVQLNWLYRINLDFERAGTVANKIVQLHAREHPEAHLIAGDTAFESLLHCQRAPHCNTHTEVQKAIAFYEKYTLAEPEQALGHFKLGKLYLWDKNPSLALTFFKRAEMLFPQHRHYYTARLEAEIAAGQRQKIEKTLKAQPLNPLQLEDLELLIKLQAVYPGQSLITAMPTAPPEEWTQGQKSQWYFLKGYLAYLQGENRHLAHADWEKAEKSDPQSAGNDIIRALRLKDSQKWVWAKDLLLQAMHKYPEWWLPYQLLGETEYQNRAWKNAAFYLEQAIRWNPLSKTSFLTLYEVQTELNLRQEAQDTLVYALLIYPEDAELQTRYWQSLEQKPSF